MKQDPYFSTSDEDGEEEYMHSLFEKYVFTCASMQNQKNDQADWREVPLSIGPVGNQEDSLLNVALGVTGPRGPEPGKDYNFMFLGPKSSTKSSEATPRLSAVKKVGLFNGNGGSSGSPIFSADSSKIIGMNLLAVEGSDTNFYSIQVDNDTLKYRQYDDFHNFYDLISESVHVTCEGKSAEVDGIALREQLIKIRENKRFSTSGKHLKKKTVEAASSGIQDLDKIRDWLEHSEEKIGIIVGIKNKQRVLEKDKIEYSFVLSILKQAVGLVKDTKDLEVRFKLRLTTKKTEKNKAQVEQAIQESLSKTELIRNKLNLELSYVMGRENADENPTSKQMICFISLPELLAEIGKESICDDINDKISKLFLEYWNKNDLSRKKIKQNFLRSDIPPQIKAILLSYGLDVEKVVMTTNDYSSSASDFLNQIEYRFIYDVSKMLETQKGVSKKMEM